MMKIFIKRYWLTLLGVILGAVAGYLYWVFIGCRSGSCPISSSPVNSTIAGMLLLGLFLTHLKRKNVMNKILRNWHISPIIRLVAGTGLAAYAILSKEYMFMILAVLFVLQAILNVSCCCAGTCPVNRTHPKQNYKGEIKKYNK